MTNVMLWFKVKFHKKISLLSSNATRWILLKVSRLTTAQATQDKNGRPVKIIKGVLGDPIFPLNALLQLQLARKLLLFSSCQR